MLFRSAVNGVSVRLQTSQMGTLMLASAVLHQTVQTGHLPALNGDTARRREVVHLPKAEVEGKEGQVVELEEEKEER